MKQLLQKIPDAILCLNREWRIMFANDKARRLSGILPSYINSKPLWELYPEAVGTDAEHIYREVMETRQARQMEYFHAPFQHWVDLHVIPIEEGIAVYYREITERKWAEEARAVATRQLEQVLESIPDSILIIDHDWKFTFANRQAIDLLQAGPLVGENLWELFPKNRLEPFFTSYHDAMERRIPTQFEAFYPEPLYRWYRVVVRPHGESSIILFFSDITIARAAEERRNEANQLLERVFEATADSIVCIGADWRCTYANSRAHELLGTDHLVGQELWKHFPGNQQEPFASNYRRTMTERVKTEFEAHTGEPLHTWFHVIAQPFQDGIIISSANITDRKLAEIARDRSAAELGQVLDVTTDGIISLDREWGVSLINRRGLELVSPVRDLVGRNFWELFAEARSPALPILENFTRAMNQGVGSRFELFYPQPLDRWFRVEARPAPDGIILFFRDITEDRLASEAIRQQQELLSTVQGAAHIATFELDLRSGAMHFGTGSYPVFGRPLADTPSVASILAFVPPEHTERVRAIGREAIKSRRVMYHEFQVRAGNGELLWIEVRGQVVVGNAEQQPAFLRGICIDVTSRKRSEEAIASSEARYRVLADLNPQALWVGDAQGRIVYANQGFLDYLGLGLDRLGDWLNCFAREDRERVLETWMHSVNTGEEYDTEARLIRGRDGQDRWWHLRGLPVREDGAIVQWLGVANDIHEARTFAETLLREQGETERQRAQLETIYRTAPIGLALFDPVEFRYLRLNDRQAEFFSLPPEQIVGSRVTDMAPIPGLQEMFEQVARGTPVINQSLEGELANRPGEHRYWTVNYFPVYATDGSVQAISAASLEITQQKRSEAALIQSEKLAAVGRLASSISHEINNPLEAITNLLYLVVQSESLPEELKVYVHMAQSELSRVSQIATQTLRFHRQAVRPTRVTPGALVDAVLHLYQGRLANSGIQVEAVYASSTEILCFENDIRQVLNNLIANAIDAMRTGGRLLVRAHDTRDLANGEPHVRITVADTGVGMSGETQRRLFEPFYTTKGLNGTGLGLWISSDLVRRHHGRLKLRSTQHSVYHGTVFSLDLPVERD